MPDDNTVSLKRHEYANNLQVCRICLESDKVEHLISPCHCKGSIKYVHPHCMAGWRKTLSETGRESDLYHCQLCKQRLYIKQKRLLMALLQFRRKQLDSLQQQQRAIQLTLIY
ncbi:hypothetical protein BDF20DRAFT_863963 [Mycotypha africana]|uniref:uncharacterized protein n=1 Tax=Mycotypha africana TaxID=64632 RepID=UPI0023008BB7|nr:uncharacterized protein BDF20DRAFT_863963 [Mycotypha africana]KAI8981915.1 hypothetical protein BDF20DRAFT_863963 [Mycotypha africana]